MMKQKIEQELNKLDVKSEKYLREYIDFCIDNSNKDNYDCVHHILPKSKSLPFTEYSNLKKYEWNASYLSYSNHFKAHWLLVMAIKHQSISFSFHAMKNKDVKNNRITDENIDSFSAHYSELLLEHNSFMTCLHKNKVVCIDNNGNTIRVNKEEYRKNKDIYTTHSNNVFNVIEISTGKNIRINKDTYDTNKHKFHTKGMSSFIDIRDKSKVYIDSSMRESYHIHRRSKIFIKRNGIICEITAGELINTDEVVSTDYIKYRDNLYTKEVKQPKIKEMLFYDLYESKEVKKFKTEIIDSCRFFNITYKKKDSITVIDKHSFEVLNLSHYTEFNVDKHILYGRNKFYIDAKNNKLVNSVDITDNTNFVKFNKQNAKKYLNSNIKNYIKTDNYISGCKGRVLAYDIQKNIAISVTKEEFDANINLIGYQNSIAKELREKNENKQQI